MVQLGIAILLNDEVHNEIRRLQLAVARACGGNPALRQMPHVTLKQPFHAKALEPVEAYFDELAATMEPPDLSLSGVGTFDEDHVIFLQVAVDDSVELLRRSVLRDMAKRFKVKPRDVEDDRYRFHSTLAYNLTDEQFVQARAALADTKVELRTTGETLGLFYYTGEIWIAYKRAHIGTAQQVTRPEALPLE